MKTERRAPPRYDRRLPRPSLCGRPTSTRSPLRRVPGANAPIRRGESPDEGSGCFGGLETSCSLLELDTKHLSILLGSAARLRRSLGVASRDRFHHKVSCTANATTGPSRRSITFVPSRKCLHEVAWYLPAYLPTYVGMWGGLKPPANEHDWRTGTVSVQGGGEGRTVNPTIYLYPILLPPTHSTLAAAGSKTPFLPTQGASPSPRSGRPEASNS